MAGEAMSRTNEEIVEAAIAYAHDTGFDEGYEAAKEEEHMTYALCDNEGCRHHDGDGCTLEAAAFMTENEDAMVCLDYEGSDGDSDMEVE